VILTLDGESLCVNGIPPVAETITHEHEHENKTQRIHRLNTKVILHQLDHPILHIGPMSARRVLRGGVASPWQSLNELNKGTAAGLKKAIEHFEQAASGDRGYAVAYAGLAIAYKLADFFRVLPARQAFPRAKAAAIKAMEFNEMLPEAHYALAFAVLSFDWDWAAAERIFMRAFEINPYFATTRHWYGFCLGMLGRVVKIHKRAGDPEPLPEFLSCD